MHIRVCVRASVYKKWNMVVLSGIWVNNRNTIQSRKKNCSVLFFFLLFYWLSAKREKKFFNPSKSFLYLSPIFGEAQVNQVWVIYPCGTRFAHTDIYVYEKMCPYVCICLRVYVCVCGGERVELGVQTSLVSEYSHISILSRQLVRLWTWAELTIPLLIGSFILVNLFYFLILFSLSFLSSPFIFYHP